MKKLVLASSLAVFAGLSTLSAVDLQGRVTFKGTVAPAKTTASAKDASVCGKSHPEFPRVEVGAGGGLKDVVIQVLGIPASGSPQEVTLDQKQCMFVPSVMALPVGSTLLVTSSDPILHNTHAFWQDGSTAFNLSVPIRGMVMRWKATRAGVLKLRCDAGHTWMGGNILVSESPYVGVTNSDGAFSLKNVPAGTYTVEAWHPLLGKQTQKVTLGPSAPPVAFEFRSP